METLRSTQATSIWMQIKSGIDSFVFEIWSLIRATYLFVETGSDFFFFFSN